MNEMNEQDKTKLIDKYLGQLKKELGDVPADARNELLEDVREHIEQAWQASPAKSREALLAILDRVGQPASLAHEERERLGLLAPEQQKGPDALSVLAVIFTFLFWPIGVLLAFLSPRWTKLDKAIALAIPVVFLLVAFSMSIPIATQYASSAPVVSQAYETVITTDGQVIEETRSQPPTNVARTTQAAPLLTLLASTLALYGFLGAPVTSGFYLALRLTSPSRGKKVIAPVFVGVLLLCLLFASFVTMTSVSYTS